MNNVMLLEHKYDQYSYRDIYVLGTLFSLLFEILMSQSCYANSPEMSYANLGHRLPYISYYKNRNFSRSLQSRGSQ